MPALSHPDLDIQATRPPTSPHPLRFLWQQYLLMICLVDKHTALKQLQSMICNAASVCGGGEIPPLYAEVLDRAGCPLSQIKGASSGTVAEPTASGATHYYMRGGTCDLFNYSALHFYPTIQNATWELIASKIHLYNLPQAHKLSNFGAGWTSRAGTSRSLSRQSRATPLQCVGGAKLNRAALLLAENGREKKYTCYLVNPQTCKIGISWMSATEMELTRDLFIVTEGH